MINFILRQAQEPYFDILRQAQGTRRFLSLSKDVEGRITTNGLMEVPVVRLSSPTKPVEWRFLSLSKDNLD